MADFVFFTVYGDFVGIVADLTTDMDIDPETVPITGTATFRASVRDGDALLAQTLSPRPAMVVPAAITGYIDTDHQLKRSASEIGVRLLANTEVLGIVGNLYYTVTFTNLRVDGQLIKINPFSFVAPTTDTTVNLANVARAPGVLAPATGHIISTVDDITDLGTVGKAVIISETTQDVRNALDIPPLPRSGPRLFIVLDDNIASANVALAEADARGQKLNLAVLTSSVQSSADYMAWSDIAGAAMNGHGIMSHGVNHVWATTRTTEELIVEFETSKSILEDATGLPVNNWVYPNSRRDLRTKSASYLRYRRTFAGIWEGDVWRHKHWRPKPFHCGRYGWDADNHATVLAEIQAAFAANEDIVIYTHDTSGNDFLTRGVTPLQFTEVLDLAQQLGMPVASVEELGDPQRLVDPGFEDPENFFLNFEVDTTLAVGSYTAEVVTYTSATEMPGTRVLHLNANGTGDDYLIVRQRLLVPLPEWADQGAAVVFGARVKTAITSGAGGATLRVRCVDRLGNIGTGGQTKLSPEYYGADWSGAGAFCTPELTSYTGWATLLLEYRAVSMVGDVWFDHAQLSIGTGDLVA